MNDLIRNLVTPLIGFLRQLAAQTETQIDDAGVDVLEKVVQNEVLFNWFLRRLTSGVSVVPETLHEPGPYALSGNVKAAFEAESVSPQEYEAFVADVLPIACGVIATTPLN